MSIDIEETKKQHNEKFSKGSFVQVMNIKNHPLKNKTLQLIDCVGVDKYGCDIWVVVYDVKPKTYTAKVSASCFNRLTPTIKQSPEPSHET